MDITRRRLLALLGAGLGAQACAPLLRSESPGIAPETGEDRLGAIASKIISGGPPPDGIPPVERPQYVPADEGNKLYREDTIVDGVVAGGIARAYPRIITVWHEIVNETFDGRPVAITYCPLTGSTVVFSGALADGRATTFGTSGRLYNSNLVMYDRATRSLWPQLLGIAVEGQRRGERLRELPLAVTTTWARWKKKFPRTEVLSQDTGHLRAYGTWPYGDYDTSSAVFFPVEARDVRFHPKKIVVGVREGDAAAALAKDELLKREVVNFDVGGAPFVAIADPDLAALRVFRRSTPRGALRFEPAAGGVEDAESRSRWSPDGEAVKGPLAGTKLEQVSAFDVQWFAWFAYYPQTAVLT